MRNTIIFSLLLLITISTVSAAPLYWAVVNEDAPASDVVNGANFAASMKASLNIEFSGRTDAQMRNSLAGQPLTDVLIVWFDGKNARVLSGSTIHSQTTDTVETYLRNQGFTVTSDPLTYDAIGAQEELTVQERIISPPPARNGDEIIPGPVQPIDEVQVSADTQNQPPAQNDEQRDEQANEYAAPNENPGVFTRLWRWFVNVFN